MSAASSRFAAITAAFRRASSGLVHPVVATFLLAAILSFLAADSLSGVYLLAVGLALVWDRAWHPVLSEPGPGPGSARAGPGPGQPPVGPGEPPRPGQLPGPGQVVGPGQLPGPGQVVGEGQPPEAGPLPGPPGPGSPWAVFSAESAAQRRAALDRVRVPALIAGAAYAVLIGWLGRFTWPATVLAVIPAVAALVIAWLISAESRGPARWPGWAGTAAWAVVWVGAAAWEIATLFLQPSLDVGSYDHPTLSYLVDQPLAVWPGRSVIAFGWLALGWYLARR